MAEVEIGRGKSGRRAYGFDDIDSARSTRHLLLPHMKAQESLANDSVRRFVEKCARYFP